jgi:signal transduction histidine kinase
LLGLAEGGTAYYLICAIFGLVMLGMSANEWRRLGTDDYRRRSIAAGGLALVALVSLILDQLGVAGMSSCLPWAMVGFALPLLTWAFLFEAFGTRRRALVFLGVADAMVVILLVLCFALESGRDEIILTSPPWLAALLLLNGFSLALWARHRDRFSAWLGAAYGLCTAGVAAGLLGLKPAPLLAFLAALPLFAIECYRAVLADLGAYGQELQAVSERALEQTQDLAFLLEVGQAVTASLDLPVVLERVSEAVARAVDADWAYVLLPAEEAESLLVAARYGWWGRRWEQESRVARQVVLQLRDYSLLRHAIVRQRQVIANRPEDYEQFEPLHRLLSRPQNGPTLVQPIYAQDRSLGAVLLGHVNIQREFSETDARLCQALVAQVATAIDNARLYQSVDEQARRLAALLRVREEEVTQRQAILESIADGVVVSSEAEEVVMANAAAARILGVPQEKLIGRTIKRLYAELWRSTNAPDREPGLFKWGDKEVRGSLAPVKMPDDTLLGSVAVFRDVTRERQSERAKAKFIEAVSHELRTPLTSMKGYIELLAAGAVGEVSRQQQHFLEVVGKNTERLVGLVNSLITVSEMDRGAIRIEPVVVDMGDLIQEAVQAIEPRTDRHELSMSVSLPDDLAPVWGDPQHLRQIMDNLLDNAVRYTPAQGRITIWAAQADLQDRQDGRQKYVVVSVRDTGVGIPAEEQERIFEKFYRADNPLTVEAGGTGVGLAIVRSLVEAHGGRVWVESEPGAGSTFSFTVPTSQPA